MQAHIQNRVRLLVREEKFLHQSVRRGLFVRRLLDDLNDAVDVRERDDQPFDDVLALLRLGEVVARAAHDDLFLMPEICGQNLL